LPEKLQSDAELIRSHLAGDASAFEALANRHAPMVYRACLRLLADAHEAEDATQAVFVILMRKASRFRKSGDLSAWLHGISRRVASESRRAGARRKRREEEGAMLKAASSGGGLSNEERVAALGSLDREVGALPTKERQAVVLRYLEGCSLSQAAKIADCPEGTMGRRAHDGLARLRSRLGERGATLGTPALAALLESETAVALPASLVPSVVTASKLAVAAGATAGAGAVSAKAILLAEGTMKAMMFFKIKVAAAVLGATLIAGASVPVARKLVAAETGTKTRAPQVTAKSERDLAWIPEGFTRVAVKQGDKICGWPVLSPDAKWLLFTRGRMADRPAILPGGAFRQHRRPPAGEMWAMSLVDRKKHRIWSGQKNEFVVTNLLPGANRWTPEGSFVFQVGSWEEARRPAGKNKQFYRVSFAPRPKAQAIARLRLARSQRGGIGFGVSPDGKKLALCDYREPEKIEWLAKDIKPLRLFFKPDDLRAFMKANPKVSGWFYGKRDERKVESRFRVTETGDSDLHQRPFSGKAHLAAKEVKFPGRPDGLVYDNSDWDYWTLLARCPGRSQVWAFSSAGDIWIYRPGSSQVTAQAKADPEAQPAKIAWGKAANGLQAGLVPLGGRGAKGWNAMFVEGQPMRFELHLKNVSDNEIHLWGGLSWSESWQMAFIPKTGGVPRSLRYCGPDRSRVAPADIKLAKGTQTAIIMTFGKAFQFYHHNKGPRAATAAPLAHLPVGKYTVHSPYEWKFGKQWKGKVLTAPVEIEIKNKAAASGAPDEAAAKRLTLEWIKKEKRDAVWKNVNAGAPITGDQIIVRPGFKRWRETHWQVTIRFKRGGVFGFSMEKKTGRIILPVD
jgi:RNA polymerase sigma factor (sigma-70 family)